MKPELRALSPKQLKSILSKLRNYEIRIRKAVNSQLRGSFSSIFKGSGLEFDDVRAYQYGDDVRRIDWHVSAKGEETYVKVFKEEKEQTVFFLVDVSKSQQIGEKNHTKLSIAKEICGVLAISAVKEASEAGLICYSNQQEMYIPPDKGMKKAYEIILNLFRLEGKSAKTDLSAFNHYALQIIKRRSIVIYISDFLDEGYQDSLRSLARKHDLIILHLIHPKETKIPRLGMLPLKDMENGQIRWVNTSSAQFQASFQDKIAQNQEELESFCRKYRANYLRIDTEQDFVPQLVKLFKIRNQRGKYR